MSIFKNHPPESHRSLLRSSLTLSLGTMSSRILGFVRDVVLAKLFGTAAMADAFFVAFRIPNLFRDMVAEGATNAALVPVLSEFAQDQDRKGLNEFLSVIFLWAVWILSTITVVGMMFAPLIVRIIAPGFTEDPQKLSLTVNLTRFMFPYLILIGLTAYSMGILYTFRSFAASAFSSCLLNVAMIASAFLAVKFLAVPVYGLAIGVLVGGVLQLWMQWVPMQRLGVALHRPTSLRHPGAKKVGQLLVPRIWGAALYQFNVFVDTLCASLSSIVGAGGISAIYYANRVIQFPLGIFGWALASATLPTLSGLATRQDFGSLRDTVVFSLRHLFFLLLPATVFTLILATPIVRVLFERGQFDTHSTQITALALVYFSLGLAGFGGVKILVSACYALQDTKTPVKIAGLCLLVNILLNFILMFPMKVGGIALASSISGTMNCTMLLAVLNRRLGGLHDVLGGFFRQMIVPLLVMAAAVGGLWALLPGKEWVKLAVVAAGGSGIFLAAAWVMKVEEAVAVVRWGRSKLNLRTHGR